jgi:DNA-binding response OmpR family regulator
VHHVLFIEDDDQIRLAIRMALEDEGYEVEEAEDGRSGLAAFERDEPDLVLLDLRLPDIQGFDVCRSMRARSIVPIIIVTAQTDTYDLVAGLEAGADDYVTKPVVTKELAARMRALLRRVQLQEVTPPRPAHFADLELRREQGVVLKRGEELPLTKTEFLLLCEFADHVGMVLSRDQLLERVWGYDYLGDSRLVDAHIRRLRVKIEDAPDDPKHIITVRGIGYRLQTPSAPAPTR